jgi:hypothetical protein
MSDNLCTYKAYFNRQTATLQAASLYAAKLAAIELFKPRKSQAHMVSVVLVATPDRNVPLHESNADMG